MMNFAAAVAAVVVSFFAIVSGQKILAAPDCDLALEVMHLQDMSSSFFDDLPVLSVKLVELLTDLDIAYPGTKYGMTTFTDKPMSPFGFGYEGPWFAGDWCYNITSEISAVGDPATKVAEMLAGGLGGGADWQENQLGAMHDIAKNTTLAGWTTDTITPDGKPIARVLIVSTDSIYHVAGDGAAPPNSLIPHKGTGHTDCDVEDYPTISQLKTALLDRGVYTIFLLGNTTGEDLQTAYNELLHNLEAPGKAYPLNADSSDIVNQIGEAFADLVQQFCSNPTIDVAFVQDVTWSYKNDMPHFHSDMEEVIDALKANFTLPHFAMTTFGDKPLVPLGHGPSGDYCYRVEHVFTTSKAEMVTAANAVKTTSGVDWHESQLDGAISTVLDAGLHWRLGTEWNGFKLHRIVALATDAGFHQAPDAHKAGYPLAAHSGGMVKCTEEEYPTWHQLGAVLAMSKTSIIFIPTSDIAFIYKKLVNDLTATYGVTALVVELKDFVDMASALTFATRRLTEMVEEKNRLL